MGLALARHLMSSLHTVAHNPSAAAIGDRNMERKCRTVCLSLATQAELRDRLQEQAESVNLTMSALARLMLVDAMNRFDENPLSILRRN